MGIENHLIQYVSMEKFEKDEAIFSIQVLPEGVDWNKIMDEGLLFAIIDTFSSMAQICLLDNEYKFNHAVSSNIKLTSFGSLKEGEIYTMRVVLLHQIKKNALYEIKIFDNKNNLIKQCMHLKRILAVKF